MSHELRTPLNAVLGFSQLLSMGDLRDEDRESVEHIDASGRRLLALIDDVLEFARIDSGRLTLTIEPTSIAPVAAEAIDLVREEAQRRAITIEDRLAGRPDIVVLADRTGSGRSCAICSTTPCGITTRVGVSGWTSSPTEKTDRRSSSGTTDPGSRRPRG